MPPARGRFANSCALPHPARSSILVYRQPSPSPPVRTPPSPDPILPCIVRTARARSLYCCYPICAPATRGRSGRPPPASCACAPAFARHQDIKAPPRREPPRRWPQGPAKEKSRAEGRAKVLRGKRPAGEPQLEEWRGHPAPPTVPRAEAHQGHNPRPGGAGAGWEPARSGAVQWVARRRPRTVAEGPSWAASSTARGVPVPPAPWRASWGRPASVGAGALRVPPTRRGRFTKRRPVRAAFFAQARCAQGAFVGFGLQTSWGLRPNRMWPAVVGSSSSAQAYWDLGYEDRSSLRPGRGWWTEHGGPRCSWTLCLSSHCGIVPRLPAGRFFSSLPRLLSSSFSASSISISVCCCSTYLAPYLHYYRIVSRIPCPHALSASPSVIVLYTTTIAQSHTLLRSLHCR